MSSYINTTGINVNFPTSGLNNLGQGFRDNWSAIVQQLNNTNTAITTIEANFGLVYDLISGITGITGPQGLTGPYGPTGPTGSTANLGNVTISGNNMVVPGNTIGNIFVANTSISVAPGNQYSLSLYGNEINTPEYNGVFEIAVNYTGYQSGISQYRNFTVYDGKNNPIFSVNGANSTVSASQSLIVGNINSSSATMTFEDSVRQVQFVLDGYGSLMLFDQTASYPRWISDIDGNFEVFGNTQILQSLTVNGDTDIIGNVNVYGHTTIDGNVIMNGASIQVTGSLQVDDSALVTGTLQVDDSALVTGSITATSGFNTIAGANIRISTNQITSPAYNGESPIWINYTGYQGGISQYRDLTIFDGKRNQILGVIGSNASVSIGGNLNISGNTVIQGNLLIASTSGTPVNTTTPASWLKIQVGSAYYYQPLYQ